MNEPRNLSWCCRAQMPRYVSHKDAARTVACNVHCVRLNNDSSTNGNGVHPKDKCISVQ